MNAARILGSGCSLLILGVFCGCLQFPVFEEPMVLGGVEVSGEILTRGGRIYMLQCASCHGYEGEGNGPSSQGLPTKPRDFKAAAFRYKSTPDDALPLDTDIAEIIQNGRPIEGMPAWPSMSSSDRHAVVQYIKTFSPRWRTATEGP